MGTELMSPNEVAFPLEAVPAELDFVTWVGQLTRAHRANLVRAAVAEGLRTDEALDAVQDAFTLFIQRPDWRALPRDGDEAPKLLTTLVRNQARNLRRRHGRATEGLDALTGSAEVDTAWRQLDDLLVEAETHLQLTGCISTLKEVQRTVVTARFFEGASGLEVAGAMGLTPGNVAVILHRAREQLRGCLTASRAHFGVGVAP